jgi:hypothetical protein
VTVLKVKKQIILNVIYISLKIVLFDEQATVYFCQELGCYSENFSYTHHILNKKKEKIWWLEATTNFKVASCIFLGDRQMKKGYEVFVP